jgi:hypothetical protein
VRVRVRFAEGFDPGSRPPLKFEFAPALPPDARVKSVEVERRAVEFRVERSGDVQQVVFEADSRGARREGRDGPDSFGAVVRYEEGMEVFVKREAPRPGDTNTGLRVLRARVETDARTGEGRLHLLLEGVPGRDYTLFIRGPRQLALSGVGEGVSITPGPAQALGVKFDGEPGRYVRREILLPLAKRPEPPR